MSLDFGKIASGLAPIAWTDEPWDRRYIKERRDKEPLDREVVAPDPAFRDRIRTATWDDYDKIIISFSGGKDSLAAVFRVLDLGAPRSKIELWHQNIDGEHDSPAVMDWPVTRDYIEAVAVVLGLPLLYQWRGGGLYGEMARQGRHMAPIYFESPLRAKPISGAVFDHVGRNGLSVYRWDTKAGHLAGRGGMPAVSDNLQIRWCSDVVKIEPFAKAIIYDPRFDKKRLGRAPRLLVVTGERRLEGKKGPIIVVEPDGRQRVSALAGRAAYHMLEPHDTDAPGFITKAGKDTAKRRVDQWRPVMNMTEDQVWNVMRQHGIRPHPAYELGAWGRCSCSGCIYSSPTQIATWARLLPQQYGLVAALDDQIKAQGRKTWRNKLTLADWADKGVPQIDPKVWAFWRPYFMHTKKITPEMVRTKRWVLPAGASAPEGGPT